MTDFDELYYAFGVFWSVLRSFSVCLKRLCLECLICNKLLYVSVLCCYWCGGENADTKISVLRLRFFTQKFVFVFIVCCCICLKCL
jgi:hypothetical protein